MSRRVVITGLGPVSGLGMGVDANWQRVLAGEGAIGRVRAFDPSGFACQLCAEVEDFNVKDFVPKSYRKATKVMARDIGLAVAAADLAARDAGLVTRGNADNGEATSYDPTRMGAHIGAGLIVAEIDELTAALAEATDDQGRFDYHKWGSEGQGHLTPLWLLKYLPNMLACHVTIIHDTQGPSNTITCGEASAMLSMGESMRVIQRGAADLCFCGGVESKINPTAFLRKHMTGQLNTDNNETPDKAVRPFCQTAAGGVIGEGGGIAILESLETYEARQARQPGSGRVYAEVLGFGASQSVNAAKRNLEPDPEGRSIASAIRAALREAQIDPSAIDLIIPFGAGVPAGDQAEAAALRTVFGDGLAKTPARSIKPLVGTCNAGAGGLDVFVAAKTLFEQTIPPAVNCEQPLDGVDAATAESRKAKLNHALVYSVGVGGQNAALVLKKAG